MIPNCPGVRGKYGQRNRQRRPWAGLIALSLGPAYSCVVGGMIARKKLLFEKEVDWFVQKQ
jgi:hypothetical protein